MTSKTTNRGGFSVIRGIAILAIVLIGLPFAAIHFATGSSRPSGKDRYLSTPAPQPSGSEALVRFRVRAKLRSVHDTVQGHALWTVGPESHGPQDFLPGEESSQLSWRADHVVKRGQQLTLNGTITSGYSRVVYMWCELWVLRDGKPYNYVGKPGRSTDNRTCHAEGAVP